MRVFELFAQLFLKVLLDGDGLAFALEALGIGRGFEAVEAHRRYVIPPAQNIFTKFHSSIFVSLIKLYRE